MKSFAAMLEQYRGSESILLVDDEPIVLNLARSILRHCGYKVHDFHRPTDALQAKSEVEFDLILTDVVMPGISGPELVSKIKQEAPEIPCIFMSGYDPRQIAERGLDAGCDYLRKPFTPEALMRRVWSTLEEKGPRRDGAPDNGAEV